MAGRPALIAALAVLLATSAMANDRACTRETSGRAPALTALQASIEELFDRAAIAAADTPDVTPDAPPVMEMLVVRVKDGKPVIACVDSKEAANRFLGAPLAKIGTTKIAEEK